MSVVGNTDAVTAAAVVDGGGAGDDIASDAGLREALYRVAVVFGIACDVLVSICLVPWPFQRHHFGYESMAHPDRKVPLDKQSVVLPCQKLQMYLPSRLSAARLTRDSPN